MSTIPSRRRGFTLLELLVVVAVIGLLLAILLPALSAASEAGRGARCGTNMRQLAQGTLVYAEENDDFLPLFARREAFAPDSEWWVTQVGRVMGFDAGVHRCPSDPVPLLIPIYFYNGSIYMNDAREHLFFFGSSMNQSPNDRPKRSEHADGRTLMLPVSYRGFCELSAAILRYPESRSSDPTDAYEDMGGWVWEARRTTDYTNPGGASMMAEGINSDQYEVTRANQKECLATSGIANTLLSKRAYKSPSWSRHLGTSNMSFVDGHVERLSRDDLALKCQKWRDHVFPHLRAAYRARDGRPIAD